MTTLLTRSLKNTQEFECAVKEFSSVLSPGDVIVLNGPLGAGKTTFVKFLAKSLGDETLVTSPTYNILNIYDKIVHIDAYRINQEDLELDEYINDGYILCIEWSENISDFLNKIDYNVSISYNSHLEGRDLTIYK